MAEGTTMENGRTVCPFYLYSSCRDGDRCIYIHDATCINLRNVACEYFLKGICKFGDKCWFNHTIITEDVKSILKSVNDEQTVGHSHKETLKSNHSFNKSKPQKLDMELCPHFCDGVCPYDECPCIHGELCELCRKYCLDPLDEKQRNLHIEGCGLDRGTDIRRNLDKTCGICLDIIMEKDRVAERRFGILENCNHVFCLSCIIKWRKVRNSRYEEDLIDHTVTRACPECRVSSDFYIPSENWVDSEEEKEKLIASYKVTLSTKPCKYFKRGRGTCPFNGACFYLHAMRDGTKVYFNTDRRSRPVQREYNYVHTRVMDWLDTVEERLRDIRMRLGLNNNL